MKAFLLLVFLPLIASAQDTYTTIPWEGHTLYCATDAKGAQSCIMDNPNYWGQQTPPPTPVPFAAFNTYETRTGGGGMLELMLMLSIMAVRRARRDG